MTTVNNPAPISWAPSQWWDGQDGEWSSFDLRVGTPEQTVRVFPSTAGSATWVVRPGGCEPPSQECTASRGGLFDQNRSSTWNELGPYTLALEQNLGRKGSGVFGLDTLSLGLTNTTGGPTLDSQIIAGIETEKWYNGILGLQQQPMNLSDFSDSQPTVLSTLRAKNLIPSLSWAYTAGAHYRSKGSFGSLTFGGSDLSKYIPTNVSFTLAPDVGRDLVVGIKSITSTFVNGSVSSLLPSPTLAFIDSTVPYLYLPEDACKAFETELGLVYNEENNLYFVDEALHQTLLNINPQFTFRLGNDKLSEPSVDVTLPYASFDLVMTPPMRENATSYFPLRRGNDSQITLGRAFLQEAYVMVDYDRQNFTVAQAVFDDTAQPNIVPIPWNATATPSNDKGLSREAIIGIGTGSAVFFLLAAIIGVLAMLRRRKRRNRRAMTDVVPDTDDSPEIKPFSYTSIQEIGHQSMPEMHDTGYLELLNGSAPSGSDKVLNELADGTQTPPCELLVPPTPYIHELASSGLSISPSSTSRDRNGSSRDYVTPDSSAESVLPHTTGSPHTSQNTLSSRIGTEQPIVKPAQVPKQININKALPQEPLGNMPHYGDYPSPRSRFSVEVPAPAYKRKRPPLARQDMSETRKPLAPSNSYTTIFDVEEYQDKASANKSPHGSF
ncbi:MAG: hypothetical protein Q9176_007982 [Flavoplaca citrina]